MIIASGELLPLGVDVTDDGDEKLTVDEIVMDPGQDPAEVIDLSEMKSEVDHVLDSSTSDGSKKLASLLNDRDRTILELRFGLDGKDERTLEEIGKVFGLTRERVRQLENEALEKLRQRNDIDRLKVFIR